MDDDARRRLADLRARIAAAAARQPTAALTEADPETGERWDGRQVWAHMAEFVGYWHRQLEAVVRNYDGMPVPFGRVKSDADRLAAIEMGRHETVGSLAERVDRSIAGFGAYLGRLDEEAWQAEGVHQTLGVMRVPQIIDRFIVGHLAEHADQLDSVAG